MPTIGSNSVKGFSSKPDKILGDPGLGQDCDNVIINKGDLCNHPHVIKQLVTAGRKLAHIFSDHRFFVESGGSFIAVTSEDVIVSFGTFIVSFSPYTYLTSFAYNGNFFNFGSISYFLGDLRRRPLKKLLYRSIRSYFYRPQNADGEPSASGVMIAALTSIGQPDRVRFDSVGSADNALDAGDYSVACSFIYDSGTRDYDDGENAKFLNHGFSLESNATIWESGDKALSGSNGFKLKVFLPRTKTQSIGIDPNHNMLEPFNSLYSEEKKIRVGVYIKAKEETAFKYLGTFPTGVVDIIDGENYVEVDLTGSQSSTLNSNLIALTTGHSIRKPCTAMMNFQSRIYSNELGDDVSLNNNIQVSSSYQSEFLRYSTSGTGLTIEESNKLADNIPNYIDENLNFPVGDSSSVTGLIEFLGQLIIFKESETWTLTGDFLLGGILRKLFDPGCVNVEGGKGYVILESVLYFVAWDGVYAYTGDARPIKISEAIGEKLKEIPADIYKFCRLEQDSQYKLLYLSFPDSEFPTFIFHPSESGAWTQLTDPEIDSFITFKKDRWLNTETGFNKLGTLEDSQLSTILTTPKMSWTSGLLTVPDQRYKKHWNDLRLQGQVEDDIVIEVNGEESTLTELKEHLGITAEELTLKLSLETTNSFRINGFNIDVHLRGRR